MAASETAAAGAAGTDAAKLTLLHLADVAELRTKMKEQVPKLPDRHDFWISCLNGGNTTQALAKHLEKEKVNGYLVAEAFTHCFAVRTEDVKQQANILLEEFGLGLRKRRMEHDSSASGGHLYVLVNVDSLSLPTMMRRAEAAELELPLAYFAKRHKAATAAVDTVNPSRSGSLAAALSPMRSSGLVAAQAAIALTPQRPTATPEAIQRELGEKALQAEKVLETKLKALLPTLPLEELSTSFVQAKLEEFMRRPTGKFNKFKHFIELIWRQYREEAVTSGDKKAAAAHTTSQAETSLAAPLARAVASRAAASEDGPLLPAKMASANLPSTSAKTAVVDGAAEVLEVSDDDVVLQDTATTVERFDEEDGSDGELDSWGFEAALGQLKGAMAPWEAEAVLEMLLRSKPSDDLLTTGAWEGIFTRRLRAAAPGSRTHKLTQEICVAWRRLRGDPEEPEVIPDEPEVHEPEASAATASAKEVSTAFDRNPYLGRCKRALDQLQVCDQGYAALAQLQASEAPAPPPPQAPITVEDDQRPDA